MSVTRAAPWTNWLGNRWFVPARRAAPRSVEEIAGLVTAAAAEGQAVRAVGAGHSTTPILDTDGLLLDLSGFAGIVRADSSSRRVTVRAGTRISELGPALWAHGLALANQGDIDAQSIAGAVATGTHGSGRRHGSLSSALRGARLVSGTGDVVHVGDAERLRAVQVSLGLLGVFLELDLEVTAAYNLQEWAGYLPFEETLEAWPRMLAEHRHVSFFWMPTAASPAVYGFDVPGDPPVADGCLVRHYDEVHVDPAEPARTTPWRRRDRSYRIYPTVFEPTFRELEYFVPAEAGAEALRRVRAVLRSRHSDCIHPVEVRFVPGEAAFLSPTHGHDAVALSVCTAADADHGSVFGDVDAVLAELGGRPHWGKLHVMDAERLRSAYPEHAAFARVRRELDPAGTFLNDYVRELFE
jgi:FAD/FMN-containing dehydrogenase